MLDVTNLRKRYLSFCMMAMIIILVGVSGFSLRAYAQSQSGIDTPPGKTELPLAVEGQVGLELLHPGTGPAVFPTNPPVVFVPGLVGIGMVSPGSALQVNGGAAIGYSASTAAPSTGLVVAGNVGIGTTAPQTTLDVNGSTKLGSSATSSCIQGAIAYDYTANNTPVYCDGTKWAVLSSTAGRYQISTNPLTVYMIDTMTGLGYRSSGSGVWQPLIPAINPSGLINGRYQISTNNLTVYMVDTMTGVYWSNGGTGAWTLAGHL